MDSSRVNLKHWAPLSRPTALADRALEVAKAFWWWKVRVGVLEWIRTLPSGSRSDAPLDINDYVNTFFDPSFLDRIPETVRRVRHFDPWLRAHLAVAGRLRAWEYGVFLKAVPDLSGKTILDAGVGSSTFCAYCASRGADVIALDLPNPFEKSRAAHETALRRQRVNQLQGTLTALPLADSSIDIVVCVSVLEHLGEPANGESAVGSAERELLFARVVQEISRVLKPAGRAYLTFEVCDRKLQTTDGWAGSRKAGEVWGAYDIDFVTSGLLDLLDAAGLRLETEANLDPRILYRDDSRHNYRGRYISTVCLLARSDLALRRGRATSESVWRRTQP